MAIADRYTDRETQQNLVVVFDDGVIFDASRGDIVAGSVKLEQYFCSGSDLVGGGVPSDYFACTVMNDTGSLSNYNFGWAEVAIAVNMFFMANAMKLSFIAVETEILYFFITGTNRNMIGSSNAVVNPPAYPMIFSSPPR